MITDSDKNTKNLTYKGFSSKELKERFDYNTETGELVWKEPHKRAGKVAGSILGANGGYVYVGLHKNGKQINLMGHRIAWMFIHGEFPPDDLFIDHINGHTADNRPENLRLVTSRGNARNTRARKPKVNERYVLTSVPGIKFDKKELCYVVNRGEQSEVRTLDFDDAKYVRWDYEFDNGYHANHGVK